MSDEIFELRSGIERLTEVIEELMKLLEVLQNDR
jgi:archaellum component FlaC